MGPIPWGQPDLVRILHLFDHSFLLPCVERLDKGNTYSSRHPEVARPSGPNNWLPHFCGTRDHLHLLSGVCHDDWPCGMWQRSLGRWDTYESPKLVQGLLLKLNQGLMDAHIA